MPPRTLKRPAMLAAVTFVQPMTAAARIKEADRAADLARQALAKRQAALAQPTPAAPSPVVADKSCKFDGRRCSGQRLPCGIAPVSPLERRRSPMVGRPRTTVPSNGACARRAYRCKVLPLRRGEARGCTDPVAWQTTTIIGGPLAGEWEVPAGPTVPRVQVTDLVTVPVVAKPSKLLTFEEETAHLLAKRRARYDHPAGRWLGVPIRVA